MIADAAFGFGEHGHLCGTPALVVRIEQNAEYPVAEERVLALAKSVDYRPIILFVADHASVVQAEVIAARLRAERQQVSAVLRVGMNLRQDWLAYQSVVRISSGDLDALWSGYLDERVGSVAVQRWPGGTLLDRISAQVRAPLGRFLHLSGHDIGHAKVWLRRSRSLWQLCPSYPLNDIEPAEIAEMASGMRYAVA